MSPILVQLPSPLLSLVPYLLAPFLSLLSSISLPLLPLTILFLSSTWCDRDERNDEGITQQLGHTPSIQRYNIIEPPWEGRGGGRRGSEGRGERETGSQKQREGERMWRGLTNKTCLNLRCLQPEMSVPWGERKR